MSEVTQPVTDSGTPGAGTAQPTPGTPASSPAVPEGFVPRSELEREQARARGFQAEADRAKAALAAAQPAPASAPATATESQPTDIVGLVKGAVSEAVTPFVKALRVAELEKVATGLKAEFPHAHESYFDSQGLLAQFDSSESLRAAVEADHNRVAAILKAHGVDVDQAKREELAAAAAGGAGPTGATTPAAGGDPTLEQLNGMTLAQLDALEKEKPGTVSRVMGAAR